MNFGEIGKRIVSIDSSPEHGTRLVAREVSALAQEMNLRAEIFEDHQGGIEQSLLIISPRTLGSNKVASIFTALDTGDPGEYLRWTKTGANPFHLSMDGQHYYGLGTTSGKLAILAQLEALTKFSERTFGRITPEIVGTFGSRSGVGAVKYLRKRKVRPVFSIVTQPTECILANLGPGYATFEISLPFSQQEIEYRQHHDLAENIRSQSKVFSGINRYGLELDFFDNPIVKAIDYLKNLPEGFVIMGLDGGTSAHSAPDHAVLEIDLVDGFEDSTMQKLGRLLECIRNVSAAFRTAKSTNFSPPHSTFTIGKIETLPSELLLKGSCRLIPAEESLYEKWLNELKENLLKIGASLRVLDFAQPFQTHGGNLTKITQEILGGLNLPTELVAAKTSSEANVLSRFGIECVVFGPGTTDPSGLTSNERMSLRELELSTEFYTRFFERNCL